MDANTIPKMQSKEVNADGREINLPGVYKHKDTGTEFITSSDYDAGVVQADALMSPVWQNAWSRIGDVPSHTELLERRKAQEVKDATEEAMQRGKEEAELKEAKKKALEQAKADAITEKEK